MDVKPPNARPVPMVVPIERNCRRLKAVMVHFPKELDSLTFVKLICSILILVQALVQLNAFYVLGEIVFIL